MVIALRAAGRFTVAVATGPENSVSRSLCVNGSLASSPCV
jgi:hypothetical protein